MMKNFVLFLMLMVFLYSCQTHEAQVIQEVYADGAVKSKIDYQISGSDSIPLHRIDFHKNGAKRMEGYFVDGKRDGEWLSWFENGSTWSKGYFKDGKRTGKAWVYHSNGQLFMKGAYENGTKTGHWLVFDEEGNLMSDQNY